MSKKMSDEEKLEVRRALKRINLIQADLKLPAKGGELPKIKELDQLKTFVKETALKYKTDFDFPEGKTKMGSMTRQGYDRDKLDEMIDNGTFDSDTARLILKARYSNDSPVLTVSP